MAAKYYIYRNLHTNTFSVRYNGLVIAHPVSFIAKNVHFKVNQTGRQRCLAERRKNVHAFIVCDSWKPVNKIETHQGLKVSYDPYEIGTFIFAGVPISRFPQAVGINGKDVYIKYTESRKPHARK